VSNIEQLCLGCFCKYLPMATELDCSERANLAVRLSKTVRDVYALKSAFTAAKKQNADISELAASLQRARENERAAERAYRDHIDQCGCKRQTMAASPNI
jgi:hypothetical protein